MLSLLVLLYLIIFIFVIIILLSLLVTFIHHIFVKVTLIHMIIQVIILNILFIFYGMNSGWYHFVDSLGTELEVIQIFNTPEISNTSQGDQLWGGDHSRLLLRHLRHRLPGQAGAGGLQQHRPVRDERADHCHEHPPSCWQRVPDGLGGPGKCNACLLRSNKGPVTHFLSPVCATGGRLP